MTVPDTDFKGQSTGGGVALVSNALTVITGDFLTVAICYPDNANSTARTISNTGTAIVWTNKIETNVAANCKVVLYTGTAGATPPTTVTVTDTAGLLLNGTKVLFVAVHTGQHATTPLPAGNLFSGTGGTDVSQAITPTSSGSALWFLAGDWSQTNTFAVIANCSQVAAPYNESGQLTAIGVQPTTQPRTDAVAFTIGETDTGGKIAWIAWEVQAAAVATTGYLLVSN